MVAALALIDTGPSLDASTDQGPLGQLLLAPIHGRLLWRLRTEAIIRKAMRSAFTRPIDIPGAIIEATLGMTHRALAGTSRGSDDYLRQRSLPGRLTALGLPVLVIFGADDQRWRSSSAAAYRVVPRARVELLPGVGHTPMMEDPKRPANCCWTSPRPPRPPRPPRTPADSLLPGPTRRIRGAGDRSGALRCRSPI